MASRILHQPVVDLNAKDEFSHTPIYLAVKRGHLPVVRRLIQLGVKLEVPDNNGLTPLAIPDNYYNDIDVRFGLDAAMVAELRDHDVLYDRDGDGEYFQIYTPTFADRFFFEIVQRRAYQGFGAPNAPVRLAAQARSTPEPTVPKR
jgi:ankyrin repeat protein